MWWDELSSVPPQVDLSPSFCVRSPHSCERNLLTLMPPIPPWTTGLQSLLKMRCEWRGGGGQHEMFFLLWDWGTGCEDFFFFFSSHILAPVLSSSHFPSLSPSCHPLSGGPPDVTKHHHPCTPPPIHPPLPSPSVSLTTFVFTEP